MSAYTAQQVTNAYAAGFADGGAHERVRRKGRRGVRLDNYSDPSITIGKLIRDGYLARSFVTVAEVEAAVARRRAENPRSPDDIREVEPGNYCGVGVRS